jgi:GTP-binding protein EngB required for normal cell division
LAGKEEQAKRFPSICFIGVTGHGKSSTANSVCGAKHFNTSAGTESETCKFDVVLTRW